MERHLGDTQHPALEAATVDRCRWLLKSTIRERYGIEPEIYRDLFKGLFSREAFERWQDQRSRFHLRYFGGPGSGKVFMAKSESVRSNLMLILGLASPCTRQHLQR